MVVNYTVIISVFISGLVVGILLSDTWQKAANTTEVSHSSNKSMSVEQELMSKGNEDCQAEMGLLRDKISVLTKDFDASRASLEASFQTSENENTDENKVVTINDLVLAGIDSALAQEIIRRKEEKEYKYLELRDRAVREGSINSVEFRKELAKMKFDETQLRTELGDDVYDRYLYATGKANRIKVSSVMQNSPAQYAGIMVGDVIISYGEQRIFSWQELTRATTQGVRNESIIVNVKRNNEILNILIPRGPLGIKLGVEYVQP